MNIAVLMWYDKQIEFFAKYYHQINKLYCNKYNYKLIKCSKRRYKDRKPHWERFPLILKHIEKYDYVVWIDADAFFYLESPSLEDLIQKYDNEIILSADYSNLSPPALNSGVLILKNTAQVKAMVEKWAYSEELKNKFLNPPIRNWIEDQAVIRGCYKENIDNFREICSIIPYLKLQHYWKKEINFLRQQETNELPYVFHLAGMSDEQRLKYPREYLKSLDEIRL